MARYELDELEADECYYALIGRKMDLDSRAKSLSEKEGLPEAAEAVRKRIELYMPNGEGPAARPGLLRLFAPQRDLDAERQNTHADEERDEEGAQDLFGGGAETGGGSPAGQTEPAKPRRGRKKKGEPDAAPATEPPITDPVEIALRQLEALAKDLLGGEATIAVEVYRGYAVPVVDLIPKINEGFDPELLNKEVNTVIRHLPDNAHALAHFVQRQVDQIRDIRERPIGRREEAHGNGPVPGGIESGIADGTLESANNAKEVTSAQSADQATATDVGPDAGTVRGGLTFGPAAAAKADSREPKHR